MNTHFISQRLLVSIAVGTCLSAQAEELPSYNNISASVAGDYQCQKEANVRLDAPSEDSYRKSRVDMQKLSEIVRTYLWLDCKDLESVEFDAYVDGSDEQVYRAKVEKNNDWFLQEQELKTAEEEKEANEKTEKEKTLEETNKTQNSPVANSLTQTHSQGNIPQDKKQSQSQSARPSKDNYESLEILEKAAKTSSEAQLELAKGLLDLPGKNKTIEFPADEAERGLEMLEKLAAEGNADAIQILSEAYRSDKKFDLNIPLIESLTGRPLTPGDAEQQRGSAAAALTLEAAAKGSEIAVNNLQDAGQAGSNLSYYALGMMYLLDKFEAMPYQDEFLSEQLNVDIEGAGGKGNVDIGLHFLTLAAENGNADAQELLADMEIPFNESTGNASPSASTSASSNTGTASTNSTPSSHVSATAHNEALIASGVISDILDSRSKAEAAAASQQASPSASIKGSSSTQQNSQGTASIRVSSGGQGSSGPSSGTSMSHGATMQSGSGAVGTSRNKQTSTIHSSHSQPAGNMNTGQNEAEIID